MVTVSILKRARTAVAPEAIFFRAEASTRDVPQARDRGAYDPSFHRLLYVWDFGDPGAVSDKVRNVARAHNNLNRAYGKEVAHVFTRAGTYEVRCSVHDPDGALLGVGQQIVAVGDPELLYAARNTIILDPNGRGDPEHPQARLARDWTSAWELLRNGAVPSRILLPRGRDIWLPERHTITGRHNSVYLGAWGPLSQGRAGLRSGGDNLLYSSGSPVEDLRLVGLDLRGPWDARNELGGQVFGLSSEQENNRSIILDDCRFEGFGTSIWLRDEGEARFETMLAVHNTEITNWGDYGVYVGTNVNQYLAFLGSAFYQDRAALMGGGNSRDDDRNKHGPLRIANGGHTHISVCDFFSRNGWSDAGGIAADQPCLRWSTSPDEHAVTRSSAVVERSAFEGGFEIIAVRDENGRGPYWGTNFVLDKCLLVGTSRTRVGVNIQLTGTTVRNCLMIRPSTPMLTNDWVAWLVKVGDNPEGQNDPGDPVELYSNTGVNLMAADQPLPLAVGIEDFPGFALENNLTLTPGAPALGPVPELLAQPFETAAGLWQSRYDGPRFRAIQTGGGVQLEFDRAYATASDDIRLWRPSANLTGTAMGTQAIDDFFGQLRPLPGAPGALEG